MLIFIDECTYSKVVDDCLLLLMALDQLLLWFHFAVRGLMLDVSQHDLSTKDAEIGLLVVETIEAMYKSAKAGTFQPIHETAT